ncbi:MAG: DUF4139 domain-containing protein [Vulcanimicrobiota bacterium]
MPQLDAPIRRVVVAEDRAFVRRRARLEVPAGQSRWRLAEVSPVIVDKSLAVLLQGQARLVSSQVLRTRVLADPRTPARPGSGLKPDNCELDLLQSELQAADTLYQELLLVIAEQAAWGQAEPLQWEQQLEEIVNWKAELEQRLLEQIPPPAPARPVSFSKLSPPVAQTEVLIDLESETGGGLELILEYCVPLAAWRPCHQAELLGERVHFTAQGCIWQNTGEDWNEVELVLSTERQSLGVVAPCLPREILDTRKRSGEIMLQERDVQIDELSVSSHPEIPGIDDGGQVFSASVSGFCSVPCDGYAVRVPLFEFSCATVMENLLMAEACPQVVQRTRLRNESAWPILAGPVELLREAGWVGRARLGLVSPGQTFQLGWGPQASLRASRSETQSRSEKDDLLGGWVRQRTQTTVVLSNLSAQSQSLEVVERIPVSELKQVEVSPDLPAVQPPACPDKNGFLHWTLELGPRSKMVVESAYWTRRRKEVAKA